MKLPQFEKKHFIAGGILGLVAIVAFVLGTYRKVETERSPASAPAEHAAPGHGTPTKEDEDEHFQEEDVEVQVAHASAKAHGDKQADTHGDAHAHDEVIATHPSSATPSAVAKEKEDSRGALTKFVDAYAEAITSVNSKVQAIQTIEDENKKLKLENAYLRVMVESQNYSARTEEAKKKTETVGKKLATTAGSKAARSIASIHYQFPENLQLDQLHALGISYFKVRDDEKAAVILNFLTELEDDKTYKTAPNYLMAGIALYRLDNFKSAKQYFDKVSVLSSQDEDTVKAKRQANYWKALVAERLKDPKSAQKLILDSLEANPHTSEARWVNPGAPKPAKESTGSSHSAERMPASSEKAEKESHEQKPSAHH